MPLFLSTYVNRVDKKGRVSVPARYRTALAGQIFNGVIAFPSYVSPAIEACGLDFLEAKVPDMPLAPHGRIVPCPRQQFGNGDLSGRQPCRTARPQDVGDARPDWMTPRHQGEPSGSTRGLGVMGRERHALRSQLIEFWCGRTAPLSPVLLAGLAPANVIGEDEEDVGLFPGFLF